MALALMCECLGRTFRSGSLTRAKGPNDPQAMAITAGISNVTTRVGEIRALIATRVGTSAQPATEVSGPVDPLVGFDPFGTAYQQALAGVSPGLSDPVRPGGFVDGSSGSTISDLRTASVGTSFATRRADATVSADRASMSAGSTVGQVGGYGPMPVPAQLVAYGNGTLPSSELESIGQGGHRLFTPAAEAWKQAVAAARVDGIDLRVTDSYRSYDEQVDLARRKGLYADGGLAAVPGTSNHGWGLAVDADVTGKAALQWLQDNGHRFGFVQAVPREPWHWEFRPAQA
ncbi:MAG: peptidase and DD-carboxypeptidase VanY/endolysin [Acidimicrobiales bacterium]|nr:peptidase and DD-carboxypeptidase VanY/endolysin [Acidimicrobiales bacterium]